MITLQALHTHVNTRETNIVQTLHTTLQKENRILKHGKNLKGWTRHMFQSFQFERLPKASI